jgi:hypothetical protein
MGTSLLPITTVSSTSYKIVSTGIMLKVLLCVPLKCTISKRHYTSVKLHINMLWSEHFCQSSIVSVSLKLSVPCSCAWELGVGRNIGWVWVVRECDGSSRKEGALPDDMPLSVNRFKTNNPQCNRLSGPLITLFSRGGFSEWCRGGVGRGAGAQVIL